MAAVFERLTLGFVVALALAVTGLPSLAQPGDEVAMLDVDGRRGATAAPSGVAATSGLTNVSTGPGPLDEAMSGKTTPHDDPGVGHRKLTRDEMEAAWFPRNIDGWVTFQPGSLEALRHDDVVPLTIFDGHGYLNLTFGLEEVRRTHAAGDIVDARALHAQGWWLSEYGWITGGSTTYPRYMLRGITDERWGLPVGSMVLASVDSAPRPPPGHATPMTPECHERLEQLQGLHIDWAADPCEVLLDPRWQAT